MERKQTDVLLKAVNIAQFSFLLLAAIGWSDWRKVGKGPDVPPSWRKDCFLSSLRRNLLLSLPSLRHLISSLWWSEVWTIRCQESSWVTSRKGHLVRAKVFALDLPCWFVCSSSTNALLLRLRYLELIGKKLDWFGVIPWSSRRMMHLDHVIN